MNTIYISCSNVAHIMGKDALININKITVQELISRYLEHPDHTYTTSLTTTVIDEEPDDTPDFNCVEDIHEYIDFCCEQYKDQPERIEHIKKLCYTKWGIQNEANVIFKLRSKYPNIMACSETKLKHFGPIGGFDVYLKGRVDAISIKEKVFFEIKSRISRSANSKALKKCDEIQIKLYEYIYDYTLKGILVID